MNKGTIFSRVAEIVGVCIAQVVTELMQNKNNKKD